MIYARDSDGVTPRFPSGATQRVDGEDCVPCCDKPCEGECGHPSCRCSVDDEDAVDASTACATCPVPDHFFTKVGVRWKPAEVRCIKLYVPDGGYPAEVEDVTADELNAFVTDHLLTSGAVIQTMTSPPTGPTADAGPYALVADEDLRADSATVANTNQYWRAGSAAGMSANVDEACAIGAVSEDDPYITTHHVGGWDIGFTQDPGENGSLIYRDVPGVPGKVNSRAGYGSFPAKPPFTPLVPSVPYQAASITWRIETQLSFTDNDEEPCVCIRVRITQDSIFVLGVSPDDADKYRIIRVTGLVFEHDARHAASTFCNQDPRCLLTSRNPDSLFLPGYSGGNVKLAPHKFKVKLCRAVTWEPGGNAELPPDGGTFYTPPNANAWRQFADPFPEIGINATYIGPGSGGGVQINGDDPLLTTESECHGTGNPSPTAPPGSIGINTPYSVVGFWYDEGASLNTFTVGSDGTVTQTGGPDTYDPADWTTLVGDVAQFRAYVSIENAVPDLASTAGAEPLQEIFNTFDAEDPAMIEADTSDAIDCDTCHVFEVAHSAEEVTSGIDDEWEHETENGNNTFTAATEVLTWAGTYAPPPGPDCSWIGRTSGADGWEGDRVFRVRCRVSGDQATIDAAELKGVFGADNFLSSISVNGVVVATGLGGGFLSFTAFTIPGSYFVPGDNWIEFEVTDTGGAGAFLVRWDREP